MNTRYIRQRYETILDQIKQHLIGICYAINCTMKSLQSNLQVYHSLVSKISRRRSNQRSRAAIRVAQRIRCIALTVSTGATTTNSNAIRSTQSKLQRSDMINRR